MSILPEDITLEMLEEAIKNHNTATCKVDCCILCFSESVKKGELKN